MLIGLYNQLLIMSIIAGLLYIILKLFSIVTHKYFSSAWHYYTYLLISTFFLIPYHSVLSKFNMFIRKAVEWSMPSVIEIDPSTDIISMISTIQLPEKSYEAYSYTDLLPYFLMAGTLIFMVIVVHKSVRINQRIFKSCKKTDDKAILNILSECKHSMGIKKGIPVYICSYAGTPFVTGLFRPRIVLPDIEFSFKELCYIFKHELTHIKKYDAWIKLLLLFINALHWFNPLAYMIRRDTDRYCETMADQMATVAMNMEERMRYCELILSVLWNGVHQKTKILSAFSGERKHLERRIDMILKREKFKNKKSTITIAITLTVLLITAGSIAVYAASLSNNNILDENIAAEEMGESAPIDECINIYLEKIDRVTSVDKSEEIFLDSYKSNIDSEGVTEDDIGIGILANYDIDWTVGAHTNVCGVSQLTMPQNGKVKYNISWTPRSGTIRVGLYNRNTSTYYWADSGTTPPLKGTMTVPAAGLYSFAVGNATDASVNITGRFIY